MPAHTTEAVSLDVVVETREPVAVVVELADGVVLLEVLPLQQGMGEHQLDRADEGLDEGFVRFASQAALRITLVERVVRQLYPLSVPQSSEIGSVSCGWMPAPAT